MSGTRSPSPTEPATEAGGRGEAPTTEVSGDGRWPVWKLALLLYPATVAAVAINLFMLSLMGQAIGLAALAPVTAIWWSLPLGIPAAWWLARRLRGLMDQADGFIGEKG